MVEPNMMTLRRRSAELRESYEREVSSNADSAALLLFYSAECGLKSVYMKRNNLRDTSMKTISAESARSYGHNLVRLVNSLCIPARSVGRPPACIMARTNACIAVMALHEAWRYGEKVTDSVEVCAWLNSITQWCRGQL